MPLLTLRASAVILVAAPVLVAAGLAFARSAVILPTHTPGVRYSAVTRKTELSN